ncbi:DUF6059 family protein [Streptomyces sp. NRRL F-5123]|uniref:DUF6059 family protein n=1 Tax=Streptomyces sp. NRRL F-5123 TaxID=1463856 RepID=UPI0004E1B75A|nr:DUF6059 family protein [Streptomyces sp. NRRL F-5123]
MPAPLRRVLLFLGRALRDYGYFHVCPPPLPPQPGAPPAPGHPERVVPLPVNELRWWKDLETRLADGSSADGPGPH